MGVLHRPLVTHQLYQQLCHPILHLINYEKAHNGSSSALLNNIPGSVVLPVPSDGAAAQSDSQLTNSPKPVLLVAEDNIVNQKVVAKFLEKLGYSCDFANNGLEAIEALSRQKYPLVLMDCQMPKMDGYTATQHIRCNYSAEQLPILALTAHTLNDERQRCMEVGMNDYLTKPVNMDLLKEKLDFYLYALQPLKGIT
jgi:CheY-like chemotaxis protein